MVIFVSIFPYLVAHIHRIQRFEKFPLACKKTSTWEPMQHSTVSLAVVLMVILSVPTGLGEHNEFPGGWYTQHVCEDYGNGYYSFEWWVQLLCEMLNK